MSAAMRLLVAIFMLVAGSTMASAQSWPQPAYEAYDGWVLDAAARLREAIIRHRLSLGYEARIADHSVKIAAADDVDCADPRNFAYYDLNGGIVLCGRSFAHFLELNREMAKFNSMDRKLIKVEDIAQYARLAARANLERQIGKAGLAICKAEYWVFLNVNKIPQEDCFTNDIKHFQEYSAFLKNTAIYRDILEGTIADLRSVGADVSAADPAVIARIKAAKTPQDQVQIIYQEMFSDILIGSVSSVYFHELGHFYLKHGNGKGCALVKEENAAEDFSKHLITVFSQEGTYEDVYVGEPYFLNSYYYGYFVDAIERLGMLEQTRASRITAADLPRDLQSLALVKLAATLQTLVEDPKLSAYLALLAGEEIDTDDLKAGIAQFMSLRDCGASSRTRKSH
jgi:hypothetical protein